MTLLKGSDTNSREINIALLSLEADIKNKIANFDTSVIDRQLAEINSRIDKINASGSNSSAEINDVRTEIENINSKLRGNSAKIESIEQKLSDIFSAENKVTDFNTTTDSGLYYWVTDAANRPSDYGVLLVNKHDGGSGNIWINQIAYGTNNKIYFRQNINSGNWTDWKAVAFEGETATKALEVVDYSDTSRTVKIGLAGPGVTADKLLYLAGYTESTDSSVKLKDVNKEEVRKWLGIPRIKYADYQTPTRTFTQFEQVPIELSEFSPEVTPNNVLCFMVTYWTGAKLIASADWANHSSGLRCALIALQAGTGSAVIRCVYMV